MIVIRNSFQLKFGKAREATALLKEGVAIQKKAGAAYDFRILTDMTGPFYTLVLEITTTSMGEFEAQAPGVMSDPAWQANYQKFSALVESGHREIFRVVE